jgi:hypothetical protein
LVLSELAIRESLEMSIFITCYLLVSVTSLSNNLSTTFYNRTYEVRKIKITWLMLPNNLLNVHINIPSTKSRMITCGPSTKKKQNPKKNKHYDDYDNSSRKKGIPAPLFSFNYTKE